MRGNRQPTQAGKRYAAAHLAHYSAKNLHDAIGLYRGVMSTYPEAPEAGYARAQIHNIVSAVVPKEELFDTQMRLAVARLGEKTGDEATPEDEATSETASS